MTGTQFRRLIARYVHSAHATRGLDVFEEVSAGTSIIGKQRRLDLLLIDQRQNKAMALECKFQDSAGTVDEKIPYALDDLAALPIPGVIVYAGKGFSEGVLHLLQSASRAAYCWPDETLSPIGRRQGEPMDSGTWQLDHAIAMCFGWWDLLTHGKTPLRLEGPLKESSSGSSAERP